MNNNRKVLLFFALALVTTTHTYAQQNGRYNKKSIAAAIAKSNALYNEGFQEHDATLVTDRYTADAEIMAPNSKSIKTPEGFLAFFNGGYEHGIRKIVFTTSDLFGFNGTFITEEGNYELQNEKGEAIDEGKYIVIWKKTSAGWKMYRDIFNTNLNAAK